MVMLAQHYLIKLLNSSVLGDLGVNAASWLPLSSSSTPSWNLSGDGCHTKSCRRWQIDTTTMHCCNGVTAMRAKTTGFIGFPHENDKDDLDGIPNSWKPSCILNTGFVQALTIRTLKFQQEITRDIYIYRDMITYFLESAIVSFCTGLTAGASPRSRQIIWPCARQDVQQIATGYGDMWHFVALFSAPKDCQRLP